MDDDDVGEASAGRVDSRNMGDADGKQSKAKKHAAVAEDAIKRRGHEDDNELSNGNFSFLQSHLGICLFHIYRSTFI